MEETITILGLMSGSSLDGVDLAMVEFEFAEGEEIDWRMVDSKSVSFDEEWQKRLEKAPTLSAFGLSRLDAEFGILLGEICNDFIEQSEFKPDYIASHGHTVIHAPVQSYSVQVGSPAHIAAGAKTSVIADFRNNDMANGGQGAPLAPIVEKYLFSGFGMYLNLGGIANLSAHSEEEIHAWDVCPSNQLLNYLANKKELLFDEDGDLARQGTINEEMLEKLNNVVEMPHKEPFSLDNSFILRHFIPVLKESQLSIEDQLRTVVEFVVNSVAAQAHFASSEHKIKPTILVTGGSAHNSFLIEQLTEKLESNNIEAILPENSVIDFKEAVLMALCGVLRLIEVPNALATVTGARRDTVNGGIYLF